MGLDFVHLADIQCSVDLLFAIFQIDIELCTLALVVYCLPIILYNDSKMEMLIEPRGSALAKLIVMCLFAALQAKQSQKCKRCCIMFSIILYRNYRPYVYLNNCSIKLKKENI